ncbi:hypothetical protein DSECCO2_545190 [anaerobic digester metagenome]
MDLPLKRGRPLQHLPVAVGEETCHLRREEVGGPFSRHLLLGHTKEDLGGTVREDKCVPLHLPDEDHARDVVDHRVEERLPLGHPLCGAHPFGDVAADHPVAGEVAYHVVDRRPAHVKDDMAPVPVVHRPLEGDFRLRVGEERGKPGPDRFGLLRIHEVAGCLSKHLLGGVAEDIPAFWADVGERAGLVDVQDQVVDVLDEAPEEHLALAQGLFRTAALGDILEDDGDARRAVVKDGRQELDPEEELGVVPQKPEFFCDLAAVQGVGDPTPYQRVVERGERRLFDAVPEDGVALSPRERADGIVCLDDPALTVEHQHEIRGEIEHGGDRDPLREVEDLGLSVGLHLHPARDEEDVEVPGDGIPVDTDRGS